MAPHLAYRDFARISKLVQRMRQDRTDLDSGSIRNALVKSFQKDRPDLAWTLSRLTSEELQTLLEYVERHNPGS
jgi:hypothetical protein